MKLFYQFLWRCTQLVWEDMQYMINKAVGNSRRKFISLRRKHESVGFKGIVEKLAMWRGNSKKRSQFYSNEYFCHLLNRHTMLNMSIFRVWPELIRYRLSQWVHSSIPCKLGQLCWWGLKPGQPQIPELPHGRNAFTHKGLWALSN